MTPQSGVVEAGGAATLTVGFKAGAEAEAFANRLSIDIADRDPNVLAPEYELLAESCIPGIQTSDYGSIFEEQAVQPTVDLGSGSMPKNIYSEEERLFFFGSHMVQQEVVERFKVTNPFKVPCTITLECKPRAPKGAGAKGGGEAGELVFDVEPKKCALPPHASPSPSHSPSPSPHPNPSPSPNPNPNRNP